MLAAAGPIEGLPAPGSQRGGGCPVSTPVRLLQRGLAEFSVGEAHQAAAVTAGPAYGSHLRGTGVGERRAAAAGDSSCGGVAGRQRRPSTERGNERRPDTSDLDAAPEPPALLRKLRRRAAHAHGSRRLPG